MLVSSSLICFFDPRRRNRTCMTAGGFRCQTKPQGEFKALWLSVISMAWPKKKKKRQQQDIWEMSLQNVHTHHKSELPCNPSLAQLITQLIKEWMQAVFSFFIFKHCLVLQQRLFASATPCSVLFTLKRHPRFQRLCCGINLHHFRTLFQLAGSTGHWSNLRCYRKWCVYFNFCNICTCAYD